MNENINEYYILQGISRSATIVLAYMIMKKNFTIKVNTYSKPN